MDSHATANGSAQTSSPPPRRVIVIGGGFGGVKCARTLARRLRPAETEVVLFDRQNHLVFSPLLAEAVGSSINSLDLMVPLRQLLPRVFCRTEEVRDVDFERNEVVFQGEDGREARLHYDHLVIGCGNVTNLQVIPGMADHAFPLKTVADAAALRAHIMTQMEQAEVAAEPARRYWHLTILVVGGGFSGAEAAGEINDLMRSSARYFRTWKRDDVRVVLIHSREQILPEISPKLREFARHKMEQMGVRMCLNARAESVTPEGVRMENGEVLKGATVVCTIGNSAAGLLSHLRFQGQPLMMEKGRLLTQPDMRLLGVNNVWAVGDCAWVVNSLNHQPAPTTGQFAERQGRQCAENILRVFRQQPTQPFRYKLLGELCSIGGHSAVADLMGMHLSGFWAWFAWRGVYLFKLPSWGRRFQVGFDWAMLLISPRDLAHLRTERTDRVTHAHYAPGEFIFQTGEAPNNFYVLEQGEVEVVRSHNGSGGEVVTVLGANSFFGERALLGNRPRVMSVRARTAVDVLVVGKNVFTQISGALAPLRDALAQTLNRRTADIWRDHPRVGELLRQVPLRALMEPVPEPLLKPEAPLRLVGRAFVDKGNEFFYVSADGRTLQGVVTITDLLRAYGSGASSETPLREFMTRNPVTVAAQDTCAVAAAVLREYRLKTLPVVEDQQTNRLAGCLRTRRLMAFVFERLGQEQKRLAA